MSQESRTHFLDNLRTFMIFLVVLYHCGLVYENSGVAAFFWIVHDPATNAVTSIPNLMVIDIFIMAVIFFVSGYLTPRSLQSKGAWAFVKAKFRRLLLPWVIAVLTLIPLYKVIFLYARNMPQENWTTYIHFNNDISQNWLWFLPVLFLFDLLYPALSNLIDRLSALSLKTIVAGMFTVGFIYSFCLDVLDLQGWTKTAVLDFQNERLLIYFMVFVLGALCYRWKIFAGGAGSGRFYAAILATAWIPVVVYRYLYIDTFVRPGSFIFSNGVDAALLWLSFHLSLLCLLYLTITTFRRFGNRQGRLGSVLRDNSYSVYIVHTVVLGGIALVLLQAAMPSLLKFIVLTVSTFAVSNLAVYIYGKTIKTRFFNRRKAAGARLAST